MGLTQTGLKTADYALTAFGVVTSVLMLVLWAQAFMAWGNPGTYAAALGMTLVTIAAFGVAAVIEYVRD
jgi:uncharacterized membrane protein